MTALCPAFRTSSASARPSPVEQPVISQVAMMAPFLSVGSYWIIHREQPDELSDMLRIELVNTACTQQSHCAQNFRLYDLDHLVHTGTPTGHQTVYPGTADQREACPASMRGNDICRVHHTGIHHDRGVAPNRVHHLR